jgi:hypothetical protein
VTTAGYTLPNQSLEPTTAQNQGSRSFEKAFG